MSHISAEEDLEHMKKIRSDLGELRNALNKINNDPEKSSAGKLL